MVGLRGHPRTHHKIGRMALYGPEKAFPTGRLKSEDNYSAGAYKTLERRPD